MKYPTFKIRGTPTPNEKLVVCEVCQEADWTIHGDNRVPNSHYCQDGKHRRMREGTLEEYEEAKKVLTQIIG